MSFFFFTRFAFDIIQNYRPHRVRRKHKLGPGVFLPQLVCCMTSCRAVRFKCLLPSRDVTGLYAFGGGRFPAMCLLCHTYTDSVQVIFEKQREKCAKPIMQRREATHSVRSRSSVNTYRCQDALK